jgi:hypothetical protein
MSWAHLVLCMFWRKYILRYGILSIVFVLRCSLILFLILILVGLFLSNVGVELVVVDLVLCTLGVGMFVIGLSIVAVVIGAVVVCWVALFTLGLGAVLFGSDSCGGFAAWSKVTHLGCVGAVTSVLFKMLSSFLSALICFNPFTLFFLFSSCVRSFSALMIVSAGVMVGCVMYFVLKNTVSDTLLLFVCLTCIT